MLPMHLKHTQGVSGHVPYGMEIHTYMHISNDLATWYNYVTTMLKRNCLKITPISKRTTLGHLESGCPEEVGLDITIIE